MRQEVKTPSVGGAGPTRGTAQLTPIYDEHRPDLSMSIGRAISLNPSKVEMYVGREYDSECSSCLYRSWPIALRQTHVTGDRNTVQSRLACEAERRRAFYPLFRVHRSFVFGPLHLQWSLRSHDSTCSVDLPRWAYLDAGRTPCSCLQRGGRLDSPCLTTIVLFSPRHHTYLKSNGQ